jgi:hypothetical protein
MSLERPILEWIMSGLLALAVAGVIMATLRLWRIWLATRSLLLALDSVPLRRGFKRIEGFSWRPIWRFGASSLDEFQRAFRRKHEALHCAINAGPIHNVRVDQELRATRKWAGKARTIRHRFT